MENKLFVNQRVLLKRDMSWKTDLNIFVHSPLNKKKKKIASIYIFILGISIFTVDIYRYIKYKTKYIHKFVRYFQKIAIS